MRRVEGDLEGGVAIVCGGNGGMVVGIVFECE